MTKIEFGILSSEKDEKAIIKNINDYLASLNRTLSKQKNKSMLDARLPYIHKHFYWNLNKAERVYFEIYPNKDIEGKYRFETKKNLNWIIFFNKLDLVTGVENQEKYIKDILEATKFEFQFLKESLESVE
ncbi:hypothetical protein [Bacillus pseudomycoides]|uniref:hypothetical protein n=1 Tax=Bacillus pseudomycoides TaxID=64104 RepID=UPI0023DCBF07|nr:hypothetical protein [Bacillus pseudomycoides]MDF2086729.1 hypothetical protein [Bacillus pseudomycoides]